MTNDATNLTTTTTMKDNKEGVVLAKTATVKTEQSSSLEATASEHQPQIVAVQCAPKVIGSIRQCSEDNLHALEADPMESDAPEEAELDSDPLGSQPLYTKDTKILKAFEDPKEDGDYFYKGEVIKIWWHVEEYQYQYCIKYEDDDCEDLGEDQMKPLIQNFMKRQRQGDQKRQRDNRTNTKKQPTKKQKTPKKKANKTKTSVTTEIGKSRVKEFKDRGHSVLWTLTESTPEIVKTTVKTKPPLPSKLPKGLHAFIPNMIEFYLLLLERQRMFLGKQIDKDKNWILAEQHFCNNYRELDRGTAYLRSEILRLKDDLEKEKLLPMSQVDWTEQVLAMAYYYRLSNRMDSFTSANNPAAGIPRLGKFDNAFVKYVKGLQTERKTPFFTNAHQTTNYDKYVKVCKEVSAGKKEKTTIRSLAERIIKAGDDMKLICRILCELPLVAKFNSWQLASDLEEAGCILLEGRDDFTVLGPGAEAGLKDIFEDIVGHDHSALQLTTYLRNNIGYCLGLVGEEFPLWKGQPITLKVVEHALCEFNKFNRLEREGSSLRKFDSRSHCNAKVCQSCCVAKPVSESAKQNTRPPAGWIRCDTCRAEFCLPCSDAGHCSMTYYAANNGNDKWKNVWKQCHRCRDLKKVF